MYKQCVRTYVLSCVLVDVKEGQCCACGAQRVAFNNAAVPSTVGATTQSQALWAQQRSRKLRCGSEGGKEGAFVRSRGLTGAIAGDCLAVGAPSRRGKRPS